MIKPYNVILNLSDILEYSKTSDDINLSFTKILLPILNNIEIKLKFNFLYKNKEDIDIFIKEYKKFLQSIVYNITTTSRLPQLIWYNISHEADIDTNNTYKFISTYLNKDTFINSLYGFFSFIKAYDNNKKNSYNENRNNRKSKFYSKRRIKRTDLEIK